MDSVRLTIDGQGLNVPPGISFLEAAKQADIYIPTLCYYPDLPVAEGAEPARVVFQGERKIVNSSPEERGKGCGLCVVEIEGNGDLVCSCATEVRAGMVVFTDNERVRAKRQENLIPILARHRHACLTCAQQEGCSRTQCSTNVPENERCCTLFGHCELQRVANYVGISDTTPKWVPTDLPILKEAPLFLRDYNLCIGCTRCVRACRDLRGIEAIGFVFDGNGQVQIGTLAPTLHESGCKFCTACVEVCPTGALMDRSVRPGKREQDLVPCREACPAHIDIPWYVRLVSEGKKEEACAVIREKVPFPCVLGRVCVRPCEEACRRGEVNEPVSICALKRYAADGEQGLWKKAMKTGEDSGKKVAVVGAGPAGLTAAFYLKKQGHSITLFEARERPGGMMRYGIPAYRLPRDILDKEIDDIQDLGVEFRPGQELGRGFSLEQLLEDRYDAVFLAVGAQDSRKIFIEGVESPDVLWGVDFLRQVGEGKQIAIKDKVIVIGGGNVAVDVALTARRLGAKAVTMACLESRGEMPAHVWETEGAMAEGVRIMPSWGPHRILSENGKTVGVELVRCSSVFDEKGNFCPAFDDTKQRIEGEQVIMAIGQATALSFLERSREISVDRGLIVVNQETLETGMKGVYAGGDVTEVTGAIIRAMAAGRKVASSIDRALGGTGEIDEVLFERAPANQFLGRDEGYAYWPREPVPELDPGSRVSGFQEISLGYTEEQAVKEAKRCLQCDLRLCMATNPPPPEKLLAFTEDNVNGIPEAEGVYQLYDEDHKVLVIKGTATLRDSLLMELRETEGAAWFEFEEDKMYSKRESELIQQYLQEHGEMPGGGDSDLDDLF